MLFTMEYNILSTLRNWNIGKEENLYDIQHVTTWGRTLDFCEEYKFTRRFRIRNVIIRENQRVKVVKETIDIIIIQRLGI